MAIPIQSPLSYYLREGRQLHKKNTEECLQKLTEKAAVDREENARTVAEYNGYCEAAQDLSKETRSKKRGRNWSIAGLVIAFLAASIALGATELLEALKGFFIAVCLALAVTGICVVCKKFGKKIKELNERWATQQALANEAFRKANGQMQPLNSLFPEYVSLRLIEQTAPCIVFDNFFTQERFRQLCEYGFSENTDGDESTIETLSGELYGKPFLYDRRLRHYTDTKSYSGSLTIHWETREKDSQGNTVTRHHSQTLHATLHKPYPAYREYTQLYFGSEEVPDVSFSRTPKFSDDKSEKELERFLRKGEGKLRRLESKELREGGDYTQMENTEFEVLFGATNRTDELEFRQMYSVQAQRNMVDLLLSDETYGDDFYYEKSGKLHILRGGHTQGRRLYVPASAYRSHDIRLAEKAFLDKNERFFKDVFFDFAPILASPVFQSVEDGTPIRTGEKTKYNYEEYANVLERELRPSHCDTECIFKIGSVEKKGRETLLQVFAYGYYGEPRLTYVSKRGDDGYTHDVPVEWVEYLPVRRESKLCLLDLAEGEKAPDSAYILQDGTCLIV